MTKPLVYLSGPIAGLDYKGAVNWRDYARRQLIDFDIVGLSPMRGKEFLDGAGIVKNEMAAILSSAISQDAALVARDRFDTTRSSFIIVNLVGATRVSIGTMVEMGWADAARIPVVLVMEKEGNLHDHPFVRQLAGYRVETIDEAIDLVITALAPPIHAMTRQAAMVEEVSRP